MQDIRGVAVSDVLSMERFRIKQQVIWLIDRGILRPIKSKLSDEELEQIVDDLIAKKPIQTIEGVNNEPQ